jgi:hypothetical protein
MFHTAFILIHSLFGWNLFFFYDVLQNYHHYMLLKLFLEVLLRYRIYLSDLTESGFLNWFDLTQYISNLCDIGCSASLMKASKLHYILSN